MLGFKIKQIDKFNKVVLLGENGKQKELVIEFYGVKPEINDFLAFNEKLFDEKSESYCQPYAFELSNEEYNDNGEYLALRKNKQTFVLKRVYG